MDEPTKPNDWQLAALEDITNSGLSLEQIAQKYGRHRDTIIKLKRRFSIVRARVSEQRGPKRVADISSLGPIHRAVGSKLTIYRANRLLSEVAAELNVSRRKLKLMELGAYDFTLVQLSTISNVLGIPLTELMIPISTRAIVKATERHAR